MSFSDSTGERPKTAESTKRSSPNFNEILMGEEGDDVDVETRTTMDSEIRASRENR